VLFVPIVYHKQRLTSSKNTYEYFTVIVETSLTLKTQLQPSISFTEIYSIFVCLFSCKVFVCVHILPGVQFASISAYRSIRTVTQQKLICHRQQISVLNRGTNFASLQREVLLLFC